MEKLLQIQPTYWKNWNVFIASYMQVAIVFRKLIKKIVLLGDLNVLKLSEEQKIKCEGKILSKECFELLDSLHNNKTPGNDGISVEFYKKCWPLISDSFMNRAAMGRARFLIYPWFIFFCHVGELNQTSLGQNSNDATCVVY